MMSCGRKDPDSGDVCGDTYTCGACLESSRAEKLQIQITALQAENARLREAIEKVESQFLKRTAPWLDEMLAPLFAALEAGKEAK